MVSRCKKCKHFLVTYDESDYFYDHSIKFCVGCCLEENECICPDTRNIQVDKCDLDSYINNAKELFTTCDNHSGTK